MSLSLIEGYASIKYDGKPLTVYYKDTGESEACSRTIVLLHGSAPGGSSASFLPLTQVLLAQGFRVVALDFLGFGKSSPIVLEGGRSNANAKAIKAVLDAVGVTKANLLGTSMGAHAALYFAHLYPDSVDKVVLVSGGTGATGGAYSVPSGAKQMLELYQNLSLEKMHAFWQVVVANPTLINADFSQMMMAAASAYPEHLTNFSQSFAKNVAQFEDITEHLKDIQAKTLLVWGTKDTLVPLEVGVHLVNHLPYADLYVMGGVGHAPSLERPNEFVKLILDFLLA